MRPTIYLSNAGSKRAMGHHGPGRMLCAMAKPRRWEIGAGRCHAAMPLLMDLEAVQAGRMSIPDYRARCEAVFMLRETNPNRYLSGALTFTRPSGEIAPVMHGDTLICGCARWTPDKTRAHPCHLELLTPFLVRSGWTVVLWGQRWDLERCVAAEFDCGGEVTDPDQIVSADDRTLGQPYRPESFGWPEVPREV